MEWKRVREKERERRGKRLLYSAQCRGLERAILFDIDRETREYSLQQHGSSFVCSFLLSFLLFLVRPFEGNSRLSFFSLFVVLLGVCEGGDYLQNGDPRFDALPSFIYRHRTPRALDAIHHCPDVRYLYIYQDLSLVHGPQALSSLTRFLHFFRKNALPPCIQRPLMDSILQQTLSMHDKRCSSTY